MLLAFGSTRPTISIWRRTPTIEFERFITFPIQLDSPVDNQRDYLRPSRPINRPVFPPPSQVDYPLHSPADSRPVCRARSPPDCPVLNRPAGRLANRVANRQCSPRLSHPDNQPAVPPVSQVLSPWVSRPLNRRDNRVLSLLCSQLDSLQLSRRLFLPDSHLPSPLEFLPASRRVSQPHDRQINRAAGPRLSHLDSQHLIPQGNRKGSHPASRVLSQAHNHLLNPPDNHLRNPLGFLLPSRAHNRLLNQPDRPRVNRLRGLLHSHLFVPLDSPLLVLLDSPLLNPAGNHLLDPPTSHRPNQQGSRLVSRAPNQVHIHLLVPQDNPLDSHLERLRPNPADNPLIDPPLFHRRSQLGNHRASQVPSRLHVLRDNQRLNHLGHRQEDQRRSRVGFRQLFPVVNPLLNPLLAHLSSPLEPHRVYLLAFLPHSQPLGLQANRRIFPLKSLRISRQPIPQPGRRLIHLYSRLLCPPDNLRESRVAHHLPSQLVSHRACPLPCRVQSLQ